MVCLKGKSKEKGKRSKRSISIVDFLDRIRISLIIIYFYGLKPPPILKFIPNVLFFNRLLYMV